MKWSWELPDWPVFTFDAQPLVAMESEFLVKSGHVEGSFAHVDDDDRGALRIEMLSDEAMQTSLIEGEILDRDSVQSSLRRSFGLQAGHPKAAGPKERGIAEMLAEAIHDFGGPLDNESLCSWHAKLLQSQLAASSLGCYRSSDDPMRIVSGDPFDPEVHFEAPPSAQVPAEMARFLNWFNTTAPGGTSASVVPGLARAAIAHLHFETIHPFSDGNGRIGRAISEKALSQAVGRPLLIALSKTIEARRKEYYDALAATRFSNEISAWVIWFGEIVLASVEDSRTRIDFLIQKTRLFDRHRGSLNDRQEKVLRRVFREGPRGFQGGLSAGNYERIAKTSPATARRDLGRLVTIGAMSRTGEKKGTRYHLNL